MKPGEEVARFEHRGMPNDQGRVYQASLRECGSTLYRCHTPTRRSPTLGGACVARR
jgi:hypothetical protein